MSTYKIFKTDETCEKDGVWFELGDAGRFKLARAGGQNKKFKQLLSKLMRPHRRKIQTDTMPEGEAQKLMVKAFSRAVIMDWEGVTDPDGEELAFNYDNCFKVMMDLPDLFSEIHETATENAIYKADIEEDDSKN